VNGEEFFFSDSGILSDCALNSHEKCPTEKVHLGFSEKTGAHLYQALRSYFRPGTYDLVRKNCNLFSDCAMYYLLGKRLERKYTALERLGQANAELLSQVTNGKYTPNPEAADFQVDSVISSLDKLGLEDNQVEPPARAGPAVSPGVQVTIVGLQNSAHLNGQGATVCRYNRINGRWEATLHLSGETKAFRVEHLRPMGELVLEPGDQIQIMGLKSEAGQALNGTVGEIIRYMHDTSRYEVRLEDGGTKALKPENLCRLDSGVSQVMPDLSEQPPSVCDQMSFAAEMELLLAAPFPSTDSISRSSAAATKLDGR